MPGQRVWRFIKRNILKVYSHRSVRYLNLKRTWKCTQILQGAGYSFSEHIYLREYFNTSYIHTWRISKFITFNRANFHVLLTVELLWNILFYNAKRPSFISCVTYRNQTSVSELFRHYCNCSDRWNNEP